MVNFESGCFESGESFVEKWCRAEQRHQLLGIAPSDRQGVNAAVAEVCEAVGSSDCPEEDAPIKADDKRWIEEAIQRHIAPHISTWGRVRQASESVALWGVTIAVVGVGITIAIFAFGRIEKDAEFRSHTTDQLVQLADSMKTVQAELKALQTIHVLERVKR